MRLLIDTNVMLDVLQNRKDFVHDSSLVWKMCEAKLTEGFVSALTFTDAVYVMRRELTPAKIHAVFQKLSAIFCVADLLPCDLQKAAQAEWDDFEDAVQSATAERISADYIVTRNVRDFAKSTCPAVAPSEIAAFLCRER